MAESEALNLMAHNATTDTTSSVQEEPPSSSQILRFRRLFHYSHSDAIEQIKQHRNDLFRPRVSDEHWDMACARMEARGYDREALEYELGLGSRAASRDREERREEGMGASFVVKLEGALGDAERIQKGAGLAKALDVVKGVGVEGEVRFCVVDGAVKNAIEEWLAREGIRYRPVFVRVPKARKELSRNSAYPTLGVEVTLPQHRLQHQDMGFLPAQNEYPVSYFFYGSLADPEKLSRVLGLSEDLPVLKPASITQGIVKSWGGKYKALVDGPETARVEGWAYQVKTKDHEEALLFYETEKYEVVRCRIAMDEEKEEVKGCTFRFVDSSQLS